jgi:hypothetical protein
LIGKHQAMQLFGEANRDGMTPKMREGGLDEGGAQSLRCDVRPAGVAARRDRLAYHRAGET